MDIPRIVGAALLTAISIHTPVKNEIMTLHEFDIVIDSSYSMSNKNRMN